MAQTQNNDPGDQKDDPRQALEEGDPQLTGRSRGHPLEDEDEPRANRTNPDASPNQGKKDASAATSHRESRDRT